MTDFNTNTANSDSVVSTEEYNNTKMNYNILDILPCECMYHIFSYVPIKCLIRSEQVSKQWRDMVKECIQHNYRTFNMRTMWPGRISTFQLQRILSRLGARLTRLIIDGSDITYNDITMLSSIDFSGDLCPNLEELEISFTYQIEYNILSPLLFECKKLKSLTLIVCNDTDEVTQKLVKSNSSIENLTIQNDPYFTGCFLVVETSLIFKYLALYECRKIKNEYLRNLYKLPYLTTLKIDQDCEYRWTKIPDIICKLTQLKELSLSRYYLSSYSDLRNDETRFCQALSNLTSLKHLNLSDNEFITNKVMKQIADSCKELETLDVSRCNGFHMINMHREGVSQKGVSAVRASCKRLTTLNASELNNQDTNSN